MFRILAVFLAIFSVGVTTAKAEYWELSAGFSYSASKYKGVSYSQTKRLGGSIGYNFNDSSTLELSAQKSNERNHYEGFEDSTYEDQVVSLNAVWNILSRQSVFQPYFKLGGGTLIRNASITNSLGQSQLQELEQLTAVIGAGFRIYITKATALRVEGTSYLSGAKLETWQDNFGATIGLSLYF